MKAPFRLRAVNGISHDTVQCLRTLLARAEAGEVIGIAYAAMHRGRTYTVHACGEAHRNPTFTRGMVAALNDDLGVRIRGES